MGPVKPITLTRPGWNNSSNKVFSFCVFLVQVASSSWMMLAYVGEPLFEPQEGRSGLFSRDPVGSQWADGVPTRRLNETA